MKRITTLVILMLSMFATSAYAYYDRPTAKLEGWQSHKDVIVRAAMRTNVDPSAIAATIAIESSFKAKTAKGLCQFTPPTWRSMVRQYGKKHGLARDVSVKDARANSLMCAEYYNENRKILETALKREVTYAELYIAHLSGPRNAIKMLKAKGTRLARDVIPAVAATNAPLFYAKGKALTVNQFKAAITARYTEHRNHYRDDANAIALITYNVDLFQVT